MSSELKILLDKIDPVRTIDKYEKKVNDALNKFKWEKNTVDSWTEFDECLATFTYLSSGADKKFLNLKDEYDFNRLRTEAIKALEMKFPKILFYKPLYGPPSYEMPHAIYNIMNQGVEGGVYGIIKLLAKCLIVVRSNHMISLHVYRFWYDKEYEDLRGIPSEYIALNKKILPKDFFKRFGQTILDFHKVLNQHPWMLKRIREGRGFSLDI